MSFRPIWGKPRLINDWGEEQEERETHWTALFYDLIMVSAVMAISEPLVEMEEGGGEGGHRLEMANQEYQDNTWEIVPEVHGLDLVDAMLKFLTVLLLWNCLSDFQVRFEDESLLGHLSFFVHCYGMACLTAGCVGSLDSNYVSLIWGACIARVGLIILNVRPAISIPRSRVHCSVRCIQQLVVILVLFAALKLGVSVQECRWILSGIIVWDCISIPNMVFLKNHRLPIHVGMYADRVKDQSMVIFGEAILMLTLKRDVAREHETKYYYTALALILWLVYSMALHGYHIYPSIEEHALRRSVLAGTTWMYTSFVLQCMMLGVAIGVKRVYLLVGAEVKIVDDQTILLAIWGITGALLSVILMRFCHFGMGRHPSPYDPVQVAVLKYVWWVSMVVLSSIPYVLSRTVIAVDPSPMICLRSLSIMMGIIILLEAALSNGVMYFTKLCTGKACKGNCSLQNFGLDKGGDYESIGEEGENYLPSTWATIS